MTIEEQKRKSLSFLAATNLPAVPVVLNAKHPVKGWEGQMAQVQDHQDIQTRFMRGDWNLGALFIDQWVDFDIDNEDPLFVAALDALMPPSDYVWGRTGKRRSHRAYMLTEPLRRDVHAKLFGFLKSKTGYSVEFRGGTLEACMHSVLPGSTYVDGGAYEWDFMSATGATPSTVNILDLTKAVRLAVAARVIAPHWVQPGRNEMNLALSGFMWRIIQVTSTGMVLRRDDCEKLLETVMQLADDDDATRLRNMHKTWDKLDNDTEAKVTGGGKLVEAMGKTTVDLLYRLLSDDQDAEILAEAASKFAIWYGRGALIDLDAVKKGTADAVMTKDAATNSMGHKWVSLASGRKPLVAWLYTSPLVTRCVGVTTDPSTTELVVNTPEGVKINTWSGFDVQPFDGPVSEEDVKVFIDYMRDVICSGRQDRYDWMMDWLANLFQHPAKKSKVGVVLTGKQGAGKSFLGTNVVGPILGRRNVAQFSTMSAIIGKHNQILQNKLWVQCDEAAVSQQRQAYTDVKSIIDSSHIVIEPKNVNSYEIPFYARVFITSNRDDAVKMDADDDERRFMYMKVSNARHADLDYWTKMHEWTGENLPKVMKFLLDRAYDFKRISRPISTDEKREAQAEQLGCELDWVISRIEQGYPISERTHQHWFDCFDIERLPADRSRMGVDRSTWPTHYTVEALTDDLLAFARQRGETYAVNRASVMLRRVYPKNGEGRRINVEYFDPKTQQKFQDRKRIHPMCTREELIAHLKRSFGSAIARRLDEAAEWDPSKMEIDIVEEAIKKAPKKVVKF